MCGVFGAVPKAASPWLDLDTLHLLAQRAEKRGPHAWGVAWWASGKALVARRTGSYSETVSGVYGLIEPTSAEAVVGHCRLSTSGALRDNRNSQPLFCTGSDVAVSHNGNVYRHRELAKLYGIELQTECDSEVIAQIAGRHGVAAARGAMGATPHALLVLDGARIVASRWKQPLYARSDERGTYLCSAPFQDAEPIPEGVPMSITGEGMTQDLRARPPEHPIGNVRWVDPSTLRSNHYNPNKVFPPELELLKISIMESGWTQPVVARPDGEIIDGFHRWTLATNDEDIRRISGGLVPVVFIVPADEASQVMATVRHNRARGQHGILKMGDIVRSLRVLGLTDDQICVRLGMEEEELDRLSDLRGSPELVGKDSFGRGWVPVLPEGEIKAGAQVKKRAARKKA